MSTKEQHFVPRVYMKAWETTVETSKEPTKKFQGVYIFENSEIGEGANRKTVLWKPHLYTINFRYYFICKSCPRVKSEFVNMIYKLLRTEFKQPVYGKLAHSVIKTKKSINKHFFEVTDWDFFYDDGNIARKKAIKSQIDALNCYILESSFDDYFEKNWERIYKQFIYSVRNGMPIGLGRSEKIIPVDIANDMLASFFIMLCRNPKFDAMGIYKKIKDKILYPLFISMCDSKEDDAPSQEESKALADELMTGIWYSELYKMFFKKSGGFYHNVINVALDKCQIVLYEAYDGAGLFITSDNPAFEHKSAVERQNLNGMIFPLTPKYLIFIGKGDEKINVVDHRYANSDVVRLFNRIIVQNKTKSVIAATKYLTDSI